MCWVMPPASPALHYAFRVVLLHLHVMLNISTDEFYLEPVFIRYH